MHRRQKELLERETGNEDTARQLFEEAILIKRRVVLQTPKATERLRSLAISLSDLAEFQTARGENDLARQQLEESVATMERAFRSSATTSNRRHLTTACEALARILIGLRAPERIAPLALRVFTASESTEPSADRACEILRAAVDAKQLSTRDLASDARLTALRKTEAWRRVFQK